MVVDPGTTRRVYNYVRVYCLVTQLAAEGGALFEGRRATPYVGPEALGGGEHPAAQAAGAEQQGTSLYRHAHDTQEGTNMNPVNQASNMLFCPSS